MDRPERCPATTPAEKIGFLLLPEFPIYALILALESLRVANQNAGRRLFSPQLFSVDGQPVRAGNGMAIGARPRSRRSPFLPTVFVCRRQPADPAHQQGPAELAAPPGAPRGAAGRHRHRRVHPGRGRPARRPPRHAALGGDRAVPRALSRMRRRRAALSARPDRLTCAGGMATLDMMLELIRLKHGDALAEIVRNGSSTNACARASSRSGAASPRPRPADRRLAGIVADMEAHLEPRLARRRWRRAPASRCASSSGCSPTASTTRRRATI